MNVAVCVPYRARNPHEVNVWNWVHNWWDHHFPDWRVIDADVPRDPFNRSASRNLAYEVATLFGSTVDVVVFANSDTVTADPADLATAVAIAADGGWCLPARYVETSEAWTRDVLAADPADPLPDPLSSYDRQLERSVAGPQIIGRAMFEDVGRWDEGFRGWGYEDDAMRIALETLHGPPTFVGTAVHLWHERGRAEWPQSNQDNRGRRDRYYRRHVGDPAGMRDMLNNRP